MAKKSGRGNSNTKRDLARLAAEKVGISKQLMERYVAAFLEESRLALLRGEEVHLFPLGSLKLKRLPSGRRRVWFSVGRKFIGQLRDTFGGNVVYSPGDPVVYMTRKAIATPKWLTEEHRAEMRNFTESCPAGSVVDHIVPLRGRNVSGLHVPWNLQYLTIKENMIKANRHESDPVYGVLV